jgi:hypothetical protein
MTGGGMFRYQTQRGPTAFTGFNGYPQPTLIAFDPADPNILAAGGADSGVFLSNNGGNSWTTVTDPLNSSSSGRPHLPRPWFAYFDHDPANRVRAFIGTQGRGVWRIEFKPLNYEYAAKLLCGAQRDPTNMRLARGFYATAINIHNPNREVAVFHEKLALTFPSEEQLPDKILPIGDDRLHEDEALEVDCMDIRRKLFPDRLPTHYVKGFVVIRSTVSLDVTAVHTTTSVDKDCYDECDKLRRSEPNSMEVEQIRERMID